MHIEPRIPKITFQEPWGSTEHSWRTTAIYNIKIIQSKTLNEIIFQCKQQLDNYLIYLYNTFLVYLLRFEQKLLFIV